MNIDAQDAQDFSGNNWLGILSIGKPAPDQRQSRPPAQEPLVLFILLILCIHVHKKIECDHVTRRLPAPETCNLLSLLQNSAKGSSTGHRSGNAVRLETSLLIRRFAATFVQNPYDPGLPPGATRDRSYAAL